MGRAELGDPGDGIRLRRRRASSRIPACWP
jgi:hypothetical protein